MTFDDDLIEAVQRQAPPGVHFDREEIEKALTKAVDRSGWSFTGVGSAVEVAAERAVRARMPKPAPRPQSEGFWRSVAKRLGLP